MAIRVADINDFKEVNKLFHVILKLHSDRRPDIFKEGIVLTDKQYKKMIEDPNDKILLWEEDNKIGGLCHLLKNENTGVSFVNDNIQVYIEDFVVAPEFRRKGIGKELFEYAKIQSKEWNASSLELNVWEVNKEAICFYEKMGLQVKSRRMEYKIK